MTFLYTYGILYVKLALLLYKGYDMKNKIAIFRKERSLTQQALAEMLSVSRQTVISLENGRYNPSIRLAYDIAKVFDCIIEEVFLFEDEENDK